MKKGVPSDAPNPANTPIIARETPENGVWGGVFPTTNLEPNVVPL
jgi:hypothetical protein